MTIQLLSQTALVHSCHWSAHMGTTKRLISVIFPLTREQFNILNTSDVWRHSLAPQQTFEEHSSIQHHQSIRHLHYRYKSLRPTDFGANSCVFSQKVFSKHGRATRAVPQPEPEAASPLKRTRKLSIATGAAAAHAIPLLHPRPKSVFSSIENCLAAHLTTRKKQKHRTCSTQTLPRVQPEPDLLLQGPLCLGLGTTQENAEENYVITLQ